LAIRKNRLLDVKSERNFKRLATSKSRCNFRSIGV